MTALQSNVRGVVITGSEQRHQPRYPVLLECEVQGASGRTLMRVSDLSVTGCYIDTSAGVAVGGSITVRLNIEDEHVTLRGHVTHAQPGIGFGMKFDGLPGQAMQVTCPQCRRSAEVKLQHIVRGSEVTVAWCCRLCEHEWPVVQTARV